MPPNSDIIARRAFACLIATPATTALAIVTIRALTQEGSLVRGYPTDIVFIYSVPALLLTAFAIVAIYFAERSKVRTPALVVGYFLVVALLRLTVIFFTPGPWYVEEYWRVGRSYSIVRTSHLELVGLNAENPAPFIFMGQFMVLAGAHSPSVSKVFDIIEIFVVAALILSAVKSLSSRYPVTTSLMYWSLIFLPLGHFSRQDYAFILYLGIMLVVVTTLSQRLMTREVTPFLVLAGGALVLSHPGTPLIVAANIIALSFASMILPKLFPKAAERAGEEYGAFKGLTYVAVIMVVAWSLWHIVLGMNKYNILFVLKDSLVNAVVSLTRYGISGETIVASRQIVSVNPLYAAMLNTKQLTIIASVAASSALLAITLVKIAKREWDGRVALLGAIHLTNIVLALLIAFSGHVPLRGTLTMSFTLILLIAAMREVSKSSKVGKVAISTTSAFLISLLFIAPLLTYGAFPITYSPTPEIGMDVVSITTASNLITPYVVEYNGPVIGYFYGLGDLPEYISPNNVYIDRILNHQYPLLLYTHRLIYRDNFFIYNMTGTEYSVSSYKELENIVSDNVEAKTISMVYSDTSGNFATYSRGGG